MTTEEIDKMTALDLVRTYTNGSEWHKEQVNPQGNNAFPRLLEQIEDALVMEINERERLAREAFGTAINQPDPNEKSLDTIADALQRIAKVMEEPGEKQKAMAFLEKYS